jgi:hypothetical protein
MSSSKASIDLERKPFVDPARKKHAGLHLQNSTADAKPFA